MYKNNKNLNAILKTGGGVNKSTYLNTLTNLTNSTVGFEQPSTGFFINGVDVGNSLCAYYEDYTTSGSINFSNSPYVGCTFIKCLLIGGGGAGADKGGDVSGNTGDPDFIDYYEYGGGGGSGASGSCASAGFSNPTGILTYSIGSGGAFRAVNFGLQGGDTTFTFQSQTVTAQGGFGGARGQTAPNPTNPGNPGVGGAGRSYTNGTINYGGNNGVGGATGNYDNDFPQPNPSTTSPAAGLDVLINSPWGSVQTITSNYGKSGLGYLTYGITPNAKTSVNGSAGDFSGKGGFMRVYFFY